MKKYTLLFLFIFCSFSAQKNVDSLKLLIYNSYKNDKLGEHKDVLTYSTELYYLSKQNNNSEDLLFSLFEQSRIYFMENKFELTLKKIDEGISLASKLQNNNMLCRFILIHQKLLPQLYYVKESRDLIKKCKMINSLVLDEDEKHINNIYILIAEADSYVNNEGLSDNMGKVISLKKKAYKESLEIKEVNPLKKFTQIFSLQSLSWSLALSRRFTEAQKYLRLADDLLISNPNYYLSIDCLITKGAIENIERNHSKAIEYFTDAINKSERTQLCYKLYTIYPMISASYGEKGNFYFAMQYSWKAKNLGDKLKEIIIKAHNVKIINEINFKITNLNSKKTRTNAIIKYISLILALIILVSLVIQKRKKIKLLFSSKNKYQNNKNIKNYSSEDNKKLISLAKEDINAFYLEFENKYPDFHDNLKEKYNELNMNDINFCYLIKMKFEIKQIALYTNTSLKSVESRAYRIRKKMNLKSNDDVYKIVAEIDSTINLKTTIFY